MSILIQTVNEIRALQRKLHLKSISIEEFKEQIAAFAVTQKSISEFVKVVAMSEKHKKVKDKFIEAGILSEGATVNLYIEERERETIRCTFDNRIITRQQCLEYYSSQPERCQNCQLQVTTKKLLVDPTTPKV